MSSKIYTHHSLSKTKIKKVNKKLRKSFEQMRIRVLSSNAMFERENYFNVQASITINYFKMIKFNSRSLGIIV
jgi:hypothetical protein